MCLEVFLKVLGNIWEPTAAIHADIQGFDGHAACPSAKVAISKAVVLCDLVVAKYPGGSGMTWLQIKQW